MQQTAEIRLVNVLGQTMRAFYIEHPASPHLTITWDGRNEAGEPVASGIYFVILKVGNVVRSHKVTLIR